MATGHTRHAMLAEAVHIIKALFAGEYVNFKGEHFEVDSAKLWDVPDSSPPIGIAVSGRQSCELAGRLADVMIAVEPDPDLGTCSNEARRWQASGRSVRSASTEPRSAVLRAHSTFRWFGGGWKVNSELPGTRAFAEASK